jgi:predicted GNAT family N-acyltransferase
MTIEIRSAQWARDHDLLAEIRRRVFIEEQSVPEALEWDDEDDSAQHWLALSEGQPVGTARVLASGQIGRMAVLARARGQGVGSALLQQSIAHARSAQLREVYLHAQTHALAFYERHGFIAEGPEFNDVKIPHRTMRLLLRSQHMLGTDAGRFAATDRAGTALELTQQCRRQLRLLSNALEPELYNTPAFIDALSQLARRSRYSEIRLLVINARAIAERGHLLVELQRRLSSVIQLRRADCDAELIKENFLIADDLGVLCYSLKEPEKAWADFNNRPLAVDYSAQFDELWHRSIDDPELRLLQL